MTTDKIRKRILGSFVRRYHNEDIDGTTFCFRNLNELELSDYRNAVHDSQGRWVLQKHKEQQRRLVIATLVDPDTHELVFTDADMQQLGEADGALIERLYLVALLHCSPDRGDGKATKKNGSDQHDSGQPSDSPASSASSTSKTG